MIGGPSDRTRPQATHSETCVSTGIKPQARSMQVPEEAPVRIEYNGRPAADLLCSPRDLAELAAGWLYSEGFLHAPDELVTLGACPDMRAVSVRAAPDRWADASSRPRVLASGCGAGRVSLDSLPRLAAGAPPRPNRSLLRRMLADAADYRRTGGIHCAALSDGEAILCQFEDIGRHNAVDKVIGWGFLRRAPFAGTQLLTTGRVSAEMLVRTARAGIPAVIALSVPTSLAVEFARRTGTLLVGRALRAEPVVYNDPVES
jgi:FdhD protein